jgi:hypothetical protein
VSFRFRLPHSAPAARACRAPMHDVRPLSVEQPRAARRGQMRAPHPRRPTLATGRLTRTVGRLIGLALVACVLVPGASATTAAAQATNTPDTSASTDPADTSAWWARVNTVDTASVCGASAARVAAADAEDRAERELDPAPLSTTLTGRELIREQRAVAALKEQGQPEATVVGMQAWHVVGGAQDEVVVYVDSTRRQSGWEPTTRTIGEQQWVEADQTAYRLVRQDGTWRVAERQVFEHARRPVDLDAFMGVTERYRDLWEALVSTYNDRDLSGLAALLDGQALSLYQQRVQKLLDEGQIQQLKTPGSLYIIDVHNGRALGYFEGTLSVVDVDQATGQEHAAGPPQPLRLLHWLQLEDGQWKIIDEVQPGTHTADDGSVRIDGCGSSDPPAADPQDPP